MVKDLNYQKTAAEFQKLLDKFLLDLEGIKKEQQKLLKEVEKRKNEEKIKKIEKLI